MLNSIQCAHTADHWPGIQNGCLEGTQLALLDKIARWGNDPTGPPIFWLNGHAGTGKSMIACSVVESWRTHGTLGAAFFCLGASPQEDRNDLTIIFPTLTFQLACKYPNIRRALRSCLSSNPDIVFAPLKIQAKKLIIKLLQSTKNQMVIVIGTLDECKDKALFPVILSALENIVQQVPGVKFFITS
jgi:hypothetical protein